MGQTAIVVEDLGKRYRIGEKEEAPENWRQAARAMVGLPFGYLRRMLREPTEAETVWALRHVSFEVKFGETLGIVGRNGAGKSTLLKILTRITEPTEGRARLNGRVGSILEVGTGFHPELTGRENVYLNGAILGMKRQETQRKFDEIVAFSEIDRYIDTPVKRYSSGMYVRLAFAVAAHLEPDILIVDEVLAVGDAPFRRKCLEKIQAIAAGGRAVLFVSHEMKAVADLCERTIFMRDGEIADDGETEHMIDQYLTEVIENSETAHAELSFDEDTTKMAQFRSVRIVDRSGQPTLQHDVLAPIRIEVEYVVRQDEPNLLVSCQVRTKLDEVLFSTNDGDWHNYRAGQNSSQYPKTAGAYRATFTLPAPLLASDRYELMFNLVQPLVESFDLVRGVYIEVVDRGSFAHGRKGRLAVPLQWQVQDTGGPEAAETLLSDGRARR